MYIPLQQKKRFQINQFNLIQSIKHRQNNLHQKKEGLLQNFELFNFVVAMVTKMAI